MSSGYFPLRVGPPGEGTIIHECLNKIETILDEYASLCSEQDQPDNAYVDGMYMGEARLGLKLLRGCLRQSQSEKVEL